MPSAPYSTILSVSGGKIVVASDDGAKFTAPFTALIWTANQVPKVGNHTHVSVTAVSDDTLTYTATDGFVIKAGMSIAVSARIDVHQLRSAVTIDEDFGATDPPYLLYLRSPEGELAAYGSATGVTDNAAGHAYFSFEPDLGGLWRWRFSSATQQGVDHQFFAAYSDVLD